MRALERRHHLDTTPRLEFVNVGDIEEGVESWLSVRGNFGEHDRRSARLQPACPMALGAPLTRKLEPEAAPEGYGVLPLAGLDVEMVQASDSHESTLAAPRLLARCLGHLGSQLVSDTIRLLTANLYNGSASPDAFDALLRETNPDVLTVQELAPNAAWVIEEHMNFGLIEPRWDHRGMGIALRYEGDVRRLPMPERSGLVASLLPTNWPQLTEAAEVIDAHMINPVYWPPWEGTRIRRGQIAAIDRHVSEKEVRHRVVAGDMNASSMWPLYRRLRRRFTDATVQAAKRAGRRPERTWGFRADSRRLLRIDHVFTTGMSAISATVLPMQGSDHLALLVDLKPDRPEATGE